MPEMYKSYIICLKTIAMVHKALGFEMSSRLGTRPHIVVPRSARPAMWRSAPHQSHRSIQSMAAQAAYTTPAGYEVEPEASVPGMSPFLDSLKYDAKGLVAVIVQHADTGEVMMQAYADRAGISETMQTGLATFFSRSRGGRWCKGETSGNFIKVLRVFADCDRDSLIYLSDPVGPACHTGARTCWFQEVDLAEDGSVHNAGAHTDHAHVPRTTLLALEATIAERRAAMAQPLVEGQKPSWTARLLGKPELLCKKIREEAGELCETLENSEGKERAASEAADLLYHAMVLLNLQGVPMEDVLRELRKRFGTSGIEEKTARKGPKKPIEE